MTDIEVCVTGRIRPNGIIIIIICNKINNSECDYNYKISYLLLTISFTFEECARKICVVLCFKDIKDILNKCVIFSP